MPFYRDKRFSKSVIEARRYVERFVKKAIDHRASLDRDQGVQGGTSKLPEKQYVFLHELSKQTLNKSELTDQVLNILLAGRDSTASLLSITFFMLARHPAIWNKLLAEVRTLKGRKPSFEELNSMTYLTWVMNESEHHHPLKIMLRLTEAMWSSPPLPLGPLQCPHGE
jgi:cytochrome P450